MKTWFVLLLVFFIPTQTQAELRCSKNGTYILFVNGINTPLEPKMASNEKNESATGHMEKIKEILAPQAEALQIDPKGKLDFDLSYNQTQGLSLDIIESVRQKVSSLEDPRKYKMLSKYLMHKEIRLLLNKQGRDELDQIQVQYLTENPRNEDVVALAQKIMFAQQNGKKVIVVSHSQGNLFANESEQVVLNYSDFKPNLIRSLAVASPSTSLAYGGLRYTNHLDIVGFFAMPEPTVYTLKQLRTSDQGYHGFQLALDIMGRNIGTTTVEELRPMREIFEEKMRTLASQLGDNCDPLEIIATPEHAVKTVLGDDFLDIQFSIPDSFFDQHGLAREDVIIEWFSYSKSEILPGDIFVLKDLIPSAGNIGYIKAYATIRDAETLEVIARAEKVASISCTGSGCCNNNSHRYVQTQSMGYQCVMPPLATIRECRHSFVTGYWKANTFPDEPVTVTATNNLGEVTQIETTNAEGAISLGQSAYPSPEVSTFTLEITVTDFWGAKASATCEYNRGSFPVYTEYPYQVTP